MGIRRFPRAMRPVRDKLWYLRQINVFAELDDAELHRLAERTTMREVRRGQVICHPSEQPQELYLIKEGRVKLSRYSMQGREQILGLLEPGNLFGELLLFGEYEPVHVEALEDGLICTLSQEDFSDLIRCHPLAFDQGYARPRGSLASGRGGNRRPCVS